MGSARHRLRLSAHHQPDLERLSDAEGVSSEDITTIYTPFSYSDWQEIIKRIKAFGSEAKKTAVISTVNGDANTYFYRELVAQEVNANAIPVMAFSIGERELLGADVFPVGHLAAWNYFQSIKSPENETFIHMWADFNEQRDKITNDPMEATFIGFRMWAQAVVQAGTTDVDAVRQAMYGQRIKAPSGFEVVMNTNHHLSKPVMIGKITLPGPSMSFGSRSIRCAPTPGAGTSPTVPSGRRIGPFRGSAAGASSRHSRNGDGLGAPSMQLSLSRWTCG
jgi:ABC-type branched-subunit amino acid transport system substrate-binding protein